MESLSLTITSAVLARTRIAILVSALAAFISPVLLAETVAIQGEKISVDIPDTWALETPPQGMRLLYVDPVPRSVFALIVRPNDGGNSVDDAGFVNGLEKDMTDSFEKRAGTVTFTNKQQVIINDVPFYLLQGVLNIGSETIYFRNYITVANGKIYTFTLQSGDAARDGDLQVIAGTIRFDSPPVLPFKSRLVHLLYLFYKILGLLCAFLVILLMIRFLLRLKKTGTKRKRRSPSKSW